MTGTNRRNMFANIVITLMYLLYMFFMLTGNLWAVRLESLLGVLSIFYCFAKFSNSSLKKLFSVNVFIFLLMVINVIYTNNYNIFSVINEITTYFGLALMLVLYQINRRFFLLLFYLIATICTIGVVVKHDYFFAKSSLNYVSVVLLIFLLPYYSTFKDNSERPSIIPAIVCVAICLICSGRGGIIMAFILLFGMSLNSIFVYKTKNKLLLLAYLLPILAVAYVLGYTSYFDEYLYRFTMEDGGFQDMARLNIWEEYKSVISRSSEYLLFGYPLEKSPVFKHYLLNLHNSYLMTHCYMGLLGFILFILYSIKAFMVVTHQKRYDLLTLMVAFYVRSFTDWVFPLQMGSVVIFYFILLVIENNIRKKS